MKDRDAIILKELEDIQQRVDHVIEMLKRKEEPAPETRDGRKDPPPGGPPNVP